MNNTGQHNPYTGFPATGHHSHPQTFHTRGAYAATTASTSFSTGYVHSGYQAAIGGTKYPPNRQTGTIQSHSSPPMRPPRLGPGGPIQCGNPGCPYSGYAKDVEIHRMDRHLIFPPGYKPTKGPPDADVGPNVTVPGTGIALNTPEAIDAWIAERKRNWPTAARIAEKQKRRAEAIERGELEPSRKRMRPNDEPEIASLRSGGNIRSRGRGRGRGWGPSTSTNFQQAQSRVAGKVISLEDSDGETDSSSNSDVDPVRDAISSKLALAQVESDGDAQVETVDANELHQDPITKSFRRPPTKEPPRRAHNPLVDRPSFLRKLLLPEIRHTVSNLSQAIRFIVDNDMFEGVEIEPGEGERMLISELTHEAGTTVSNQNQSNS